MKKGEEGILKGEKREGMGECGFFLMGARLKGWSECTSQIAGLLKTMTRGRIAHKRVDICKEWGGIGC